MAVVVEQTIPFPPSTLDLHNPSRWTTLFPLIRPTVHAISTAKGPSILADRSKAHGKKYLHLVAAGAAGHFSSKLLDDKHVTAIVTETYGAGLLTAADLPHALAGAGFELGPGVVLVRAGKERRLQVHAPDVLEVTVAGELEQDHLLHVLGTATGGTRANPHNTAELVRNWVRGAKVVRSRFHVEKAEGKPAVVHADGPRGFDGVREAVERDVREAMESKVVGEIEGRGERVTYSVHFSDVNGLSRLENYIVVGEIAKFLGEWEEMISSETGPFDLELNREGWLTSNIDEKGLKYCLSHSTILNHDELARGFAISICPMPEHFLTASPRPQPHQTIGDSSSEAAAEKKTSSPSPSKMSFDDKEVRRRIENACNAVIKEEPTITEYDTIVGDGDCGYTLRDGAKKVLDFIADKDLSRLPETLGDLVRELEIEMGGTSGALYCIYLTSLANSLTTETNIPAALRKALNELCKYTNARVGDRTMMDSLIPFIETLASTNDSGKALQKSKEGVEGTKQMEAKLGRSTYLDESATKGVPDPGAYGLFVLFDGMSK